MKNTKEYNQIYYKKNRKNVLKKNNQWYQDNKSKALDNAKIYYSDKKEVMHNYMKKYRDSLRDQALSHYSNGELKCSCCQEKNRIFLCIDHINNDGYKHRKEVGMNIMLWLKQNHYPGGFQVLCYNCNIGKRLNGGICPHAEQLLPV